jgi:hypothetical protein
MSAPEGRWQVRDTMTGAVVGTYGSLKTAHRVADRKDAEYGAVRYVVGRAAVTIAGARTIEGARRDIARLAAAVARETVPTAEGMQARAAAGIGHHIMRLKVLAEHGARVRDVECVELYCDGERAMVRHGVDGLAMDVTPGE